MTKYIIVCKACGTPLMKTKQPMVVILDVEIKCQNCKKIIYLPEDARIIREQKDKQDKKLDKLS